MGRFEMHSSGYCKNLILMSNWHPKNILWVRLKLTAIVPPVGHPFNPSLVFDAFDLWWTSTARNKSTEPSFFCFVGVLCGPNETILVQNDRIHATIWNTEFPSTFFLPCAYLGTKRSKIGKPIGNFVVLHTKWFVTQGANPIIKPRTVKGDFGEHSCRNQFVDSILHRQRL